LRGLPLDGDLAGQLGRDLADLLLPLVGGRERFVRDDGAGPRGADERVFLANQLDQPLLLPSERVRRRGRRLLLDLLRLGELADARRRLLLGPRLLGQLPRQLLNLLAALITRGRRLGRDLRAASAICM
jgi:hypothetical protein